MRFQSERYFKNRIEAGQQLASFLEGFSSKNAVLYALPRGGVIIGGEVARKFNIPFDIIVTNKIKDPYDRELALGAVAEDGHSVLSDNIFSVDIIWIAQETERAIKEAKLRNFIYLKGRKHLSCLGKTAIIVDDGLATGLTARAAIKELKIHFHPKNIVVAAPVVSKEAAEEIEKEGVKVISILTIKEFRSVGSYYLHFPQLTDLEVLRNVNFFLPNEKKKIHKKFPEVISYSHHPNLVIHKGV